MKATALLHILACVGLVADAHAQITITEADVRASIGSEVSTTFYEATTFTGLQALADQTGGNLTFDFTTATFGPGETFTVDLVTCSSELPGCDDPDFATADFVARESSQADDSVAVSFALLQADGLYVLGGASRSDFDPSSPGPEEVIFKFNPALLLQKLPMTMGTSWTSETAFESTAFEEVVFMQDNTYEVEGWGTLVTASGQAEALKLREQSISTFTVGEFTFTDTTYTITFYTKNLFSAGIDLDAQGTVIAAQYTTSNSTTDVDSGAEQPERATLAQNYPNPFNPSTTIPFTLREAGPVTVSVVDLLGRTVAVLVDEVRPAGPYEVTWRAEEAPSGLYLVRLDASGVRLTRALNLLK